MADDKLNVYNVYNLEKSKYKDQYISKQRDKIDTTIGESLDGIIGNNVYDNLLYIPNWTFDQFVTERTKFRRQGLDGNGTSAYNDPGSFFYKVFFNFNTSFGLLGSLLTTGQNNSSLYGKSVNTAWGYLENNIYGGKFSEYYKRVLAGKQKSLESFGKILNYLTFECPWFFKEIGGLADITKRNYNEIVQGTDKQITLTFNQDAVDMRISTLLDLYVNACFDTINFKEVVPENLRKFDMSIIIFNPPIANLNVSTQYRSVSEIDMHENRLSELKQQGFNARDWYFPTDGELSNMNWGGIMDPEMSFKCIILKNCEININELTTTPETLSSSDPSSLDYTININYQRSYIYNLNKVLSIELLDNLYIDADFNQLTFDLPKFEHPPVDTPDPPKPTPQPEPEPKEEIKLDEYLTFVSKYSYESAESQVVNKYWETFKNNRKDKYTDFRYEFSRFEHKGGKVECYFARKVSYNGKFGVRMYIYAKPL